MLPAMRLDAIAIIRLEAISSRLEAITSRLEAIAIWLKAIAGRLEAIAIRLAHVACYGSFVFAVEPPGVLELRLSGGLVLRRIW